MRYAGSGFSDMTAVASSFNPQEFLASVSENNEKMIPMLHEMLERLMQIKTALSSADSQKLHQNMVEDVRDSALQTSVGAVAMAGIASEARMM